MLARLPHFFWPRESNNFRARFLHSTFLIGILSAFLIFQTFVSGVALIGPQILGYAVNISPDDVVSLTNQRRQEAGLEPLRLNDQLSSAALAKAADMFTLDYWAHNSPEGKEPWTFIKNAGYNYRYAGENLARDFPDSGGVVLAWMASPTHRDNILSARYQEIGVAVINGTLQGRETTLVVQMFGSRSFVPQIAQVTPGTPAPPVVGGAEVTPAPATPLATPVPTPPPPPAGPPVVSETALVAAAGFEGASLASPFVATKTVALAIFGSLFALFSFDALMVYRQRLVRLTGKSWLHAAFVATLLAAALLTNQGAIL